MDSEREPFQKKEIAYGIERLRFEPPFLQFEVKAGGEYRGSFCIHVSEASEAEGRVYAADERMTCPEGKFRGRDLEVPFLFDAAGMEYGDTQKGEFCIASDQGEYFLPYEARVPGGLTGGELGEIKNLFHFANLAKLNWEEAVKCFYQEEFSQLLTGNNRQYLETYRALAKNGRESGRPDFAMEQFLILIRKKQPVSYECPVTEFSYDRAEVPQSVEIRIKRIGWGYTALSVLTDAEFLQPEQDGLREEDFSHEEALLRVRLCKDKLHAGKNIGSVRLKGDKQELVCQIRVTARPISGDGQTARRRQKQMTDCMLRLYLDYRTGRRPIQESVAAAAEVLAQERGINALMPALYQAHLKLLTEQDNEAVWLLGRARQMMEGKEMPLDIYGYFLYLTAMSESEDKQRAGELIDDYVRQYPEQFVLYWCYLHKEGLQKKNPGAVYRRLKELWEGGCFHPVLYLEAAMAVMEQPSLLAALDPFELQLLLFMDRYALITPTLVEQMYTAGERLRKYHPLLFRIFEKYPGGDEKKRTKVLCLLYLRGRLKGRKAADAMRAAIECDCRITGLYEAYIYALDYEKETVLPGEVVRYFAYDTAMDEGHLAYVYAAVLRQQEKLPSEYENRIRAFTVKQLSAGRIDDSLAYLYRHALMPEDMTEQRKEALLELCFVREITAANPDYRYCIVRHEGVDRQERVALREHKAQIRLYCERYVILLEDSNGLCHLPENDCKVRAYPGLSRIQLLLKDCKRINFGALFAELCARPVERAKSREEFGAAAENALWLLRQKELTAEFRKELAGKLLDGYVRWEPEETDAFLSQADARDFLRRDRAKLAALLCENGYTQKAFEAVRLCGYAKADVRVLAKLCTLLLKERQGEYDIGLLKLAYQVFERGKYTEAMLAYLEQWFQGSVRQMRNIWRAAVEMEVPVFALSERILEQLLHTGAYIADRERIFLYYAEHGGRGDMIGYYLSIRGEAYLVREEAVRDEIFRMIAERLQNGETLSLGAELALLKYESGRVARLTEEEKRLCAGLLGDSLGENIYFPYYKAFTDFYPELLVYEENCYVEYRAAPGSRVVLHSILDKPGQEAEGYCKEEMTEIYPGIFQKEVRLFWGERLQYYVTLMQNGEEQFVLSGSLEQKETMFADGHGSFRLLMDIALSLELHDLDTADILAQEYARSAFLTKEMLKIR